MLAREQLQIIDKLKEVAKSKKLTYSKIATGTKISESSIKKIFAGSDCSFSKVIGICQFLDVNFFDLTESIKVNQKEKSFEFSISQEQFFAHNLNYYLFFHKIFRDGLTVVEAMELFNIDRKESWIILRKLESFNLLEITNYPKVSFKVTGALNYLKEGPLQSKILDQVISSFSNYLLHGPLIKQPVDSPFLRLYFAKTTKETYDSYLRELRRVHEDFAGSAIKDRKFMAPDDLIDVTWLFGLANCHGLNISYQN